MSFKSLLADFSRLPQIFAAGKIKFKEEIKQLRNHPAQKLYQYIRFIWKALKNFRFRKLPLIRKLKILDYYLLRECFAPFMVGTVFFTFIMVIQRIGDLVKLTMEKATPWYVTLKLFFYMLPFTAALTVPMGLLFGVLMAYGSLSSTSEITAMRANGVSLFRMFLPSAALGLVMALFMFWFINVLMPVTNYRYRALYRSIIFSNPGILLEERVFTDVPSSTQKISALGMSRDGKTMESVFIFENNDAENKVKITYADKGNWSNNDVNSPLINLILRNGRTLEMSWDKISETQDLEFESIRLNIRNSIRENEAHKPGPRELPAWDVKKRIDVLRAERPSNMPPQKIMPKDEANLWIEFHKKYSLPASCAILVLIAMPMGITFRRSGKGIAFGWGIVVIFIYYFFMTLGETLGTRQIITPHLSMWLPNIVFLLAGILLFLKKVRQ